MVGGQGGNASCTVAPEGIVYGTLVRLASGSSRPLDKSAALTYPPKPSYDGEPGHIPLREIYGWTCIMIEISDHLPRNASRSSFSSQYLKRGHQYLSWVVPLLSTISLCRVSSVVRHLRSRFAPCSLIYRDRSVQPADRLDARRWAGRYISQQKLLYVVQSPPLFVGRPVGLSFGLVGFLVRLHCRF